MGIDVIGLDFAYHSANGDWSIFKNASAHFSHGKFYALMGPSGSGKTTLFRLLTRMVEPAEGRISVNERNISDISISELRSSVFGQIFQDYLLVPFLTTTENLLLVREIAVGHAGHDEQRRAHKLLECVGLAEHSGHTVELLSGGEQQRVAIARALMGDARILLADEPTGALDADHTAQIGRLLDSLAHDKGMMVIAGTHDHDFASHADSVVVIRDRRFTVE